MSVCALVSFIVMALFFSVPLYAQEARGTITGNVSDANKAAIPGASVKITNVAMGTSVTVQTNDAGFFQAPYLLPGTYQITVEGTGFKKYIRDGVILRVNDTLEINIEMEVGAVDESVTVTTETPLLDTTSASMGQVVDSRRIAELPTPHGDPFVLIGLSPGVSYTGAQRLDRPFEPTHIVGYAMDGTRGNRSDITIDGAPSTATANANEVIASYVPPADIVQEFKVQTATFDASSGNTEGGVTNLNIKSGGNDFHGTAYWAKIPVKLTANDFFGNRGNIARPSFSYDRFGGYISGPVIFPKLYNGRNRTFFLWGYENIDEARPRNNGVPTVPTEKMKRGDFSELLALGPQYQIYNPFTRRRLPNGRIQADPFPGNIIPPNLINPVARRIVDQYFPSPRSAGNPDGTQNYQRPELLERTKYYTSTIRIDHIVSDRQRIFVRGSWYPRDSNYNNYFDNIATGEWFLFASRQGAIDDVYTFNPTTVLNARYSYNRFIRGTNSNPGNRGMDLTTLGFPAYYNNLIPEDIRRFPRFDIAGYQGTGIGGEFRPIDTHAVNATLNKVLGVHSLKFGMEFRVYRENDFFFANNQTGQFNFDSTWTRGPFDNSPTSPNQLGQSFAAFLLGLPSPGSFVARAASYAEQSTTWGLFVHDDWKFNSKLTLNIGLRYEVEGALTERYNRSVRGFDYNYVQPFEAAARAAYAASQTGTNATPEIPASQFNVRGGLTFAGVNGEPRGLYETPKMNFMPRFGFAYRLTEDGKTVVRGGYGIFFGFLGQRRGDVIQSGFSQNTPVNVSTDNGLTFIETLSNPFQNGIQEPVGAALGPQTFLGQSITFFNPNPKTPYMQRWQLGIQRELPGGFVAEIAYVGNRGTHIEVTRNINATPNRYLSTSPVRDQARIDYLSQLVPNPFRGLMPATASAVFRADTIARERLLRPYPQFDQVNTTTNEGYSWYHSMQLGLQKRFSKGYTLGVGYTFSKFMEAVELLNAGDPRPTEMISPADRPHRLAVSGIYELPFGPGRMFLKDVHPVLAKIIGGWQIGGIYVYQSGPPIGNWGNLIFRGNLRDVPLPEDQQDVTRFFNPNAGFERNNNLQLGANVRTFPLRFGFIRADNINNYDLSVLKRTAITEGTSLEFRAEFLNAFNHPLFPNALNLNPTQASFGAITSSTQDNYARRIQLMIKFLF
jgi:hypothetical protein